MNINEIWDYVKDVPGTAGRCDGYVTSLNEIANRLPDNLVIVEIGTFHGGSACVFGLTLKDKNPKIYCVDPAFIKDEERPAKYNSFEGVPPYTLEYATNNFKRCGVDKYITCMPGSSEEVLSKWNGEKFDMLYIDGSHTYEEVRIDMMWLQYAKDKCILMLDDWICHVSDACMQHIGNYPGFAQRPDGTFWPMYFTRGY